jgi:hypothetical protein
MAGQVAMTSIAKGGAWALAGLVIVLGIAYVIL